MSKKFDLIVFGGSGFTGKFVVEEIVRLSQVKEEQTLKWAVAGRSRQKLKDILKEISTETGVNLDHVKTIEADVAKLKSLIQMANQGSVVLNCVGPYRFRGEAVVKACISQGTHYVDLSAEPQFHERIQAFYHGEAEKNESYVVSSCGFDSIPSDVGVTLLQKEFGGDLNSVEMYYESILRGPPPKTHYGTYESVIHAVAHRGELDGLRKLLFPNQLPTPTHELEHKGYIHKSKLVNGWCVPFLGIDVSVVKRSQYYFHEHDNIRPVQMTAYMKLPFFKFCIYGLFLAFIIKTLSLFKLGVYLLLKYPEFFTMGSVSREGSPKSMLNNIHFKFTLMGQGWKDSQTQKHLQPPNKKLNVTVTGIDPGYSGTARMIVQSALTILKESHNMPFKGGVYSPGAAFAKTDLVNRLNSNGIQFSIVPPITP